jgi:uncharacterized protein
MKSNVTPNPLSASIGIVIKERLMWLGLGCIAVFAHVQAASFDCPKAAEKNEKFICNDPLLSKLDDALNKTYQQVMKRFDNKQQQSLVAEQKNWLKHTRNVCDDEPCLEQAYLLRSDKLSSIFEPKVRGSVEEGQKLELTKQNQNGVTQAQISAPASQEDIQKLLNWQHRKLIEVQKGARDVLFWGDGGMPKDDSGYCERFWHALKTQEAFNIPPPTMLAVGVEGHVKLMERLHDYAKSNFERYLSQGGKLSPSKYRIGNKDWRIGPSLNGKTNDPKDLPKKFEKVWQRTSDNYSVLDEYSLLDKNIMTSILYLQPPPVPGYVRPLVITFAQDKCSKCTGVSMRIRAVGIDGLPGHDWFRGQYLNRPSYEDAEANNRSVPLAPKIPYLLIGMGVFNGTLTFWTLEHKTWVDDPIAEEKGIHYYKPGDLKDYFRGYAVNVIPLDDNPGYEGPVLVCSVQFN